MQWLANRVGTSRDNDFDCECAARPMSSQVSYFVAFLLSSSPAALEFSAMKVLGERPVNLQCGDSFVAAKGEIPKTKDQTAKSSHCIESFVCDVLPGFATKRAGL